MRVIASGVGQQTNIIDELRIADAQSYKEWTSSNLKRFLQQTATTFPTLMAGLTRTNSYQLKSMRVDESWRSNASESCNSN